MLKTLVAITMVMWAVGTSVPAVGGSGAGCPEKFDQVGEYCLHVSTEFEGRFKEMYWHIARQECKDLAAAGWTTDLVILKDTDKLAVLSKHIHENFEAFRFYVWFVGARQVAGEPSPWMWVDDTPVDSFSYLWLPDHPSVNTTMNVAKLVPASAEPYRLYMQGVTTNSNAPSFVCEAVAE